MEKIKNLEKYFSNIDKKEEIKPKETFDFMTAVKYMKEGKKVRIKEWTPESYIYAKSIHYILDECNDEYSFSIFGILEGDWELYNE